jgi:hypothetical protein
MPMYYFCLHDSEDVVDADGTELPDLMPRATMQDRWPGN